MNALSNAEVEDVFLQAASLKDRYDELRKREMRSRAEPTPCYCNGPQGSDSACGCAMRNVRSAALDSQLPAPARASAPTSQVGKIDIAPFDPGTLDRPGNPHIGVDAGVPRGAPVRSILAIDPGTKQSGWCLLVEGRVLASGVEPNDIVLGRLKTWGSHRIAIEMIASYGMAVGREVFETCVWIGRFIEASHTPGAVQLVYRKDVKLHLCGTPRAKDTNIRQALIDMFPATGGGKTPQVGTKGQPGPLFGVSTHVWPALAVAVTVAAAAPQGALL